jgi:hypothetical protein
VCRLLSWINPKTGQPAPVAFTEIPAQKAAAEEKGPVTSEANPISWFVLTDSQGQVKNDWASDSGPARASEYGHTP